MKACILRIGSRPILDKKSIVSLEIWHLRKWLMEDGASEVHVHTQKIRESKNLDWAVDCESLDEYDIVYVHCSNPNFFGGKVGDYTKKAAMLLARRTGPVVYVVNDPSVAPVNFPMILLQRGFVQSDEWRGAVLWMADQLALSSVMFSGSYAAFKKWDNEFDLQFVKPNFSGFFQYIAQNSFTILDVVDPTTCEFDVCYYGASRGSHRQRKIAQYLPYVSSIVIGHKNDNCAVNVPTMQTHANLVSHVRRAAGSLIIGDELHEAGWGTMRVYEAPWWGLVSFIDAEFGSRYADWINDLVVVRDGQELSDKVSRINEENLWEEIVTCQRNHWGIV